MRQLAPPYRLICEGLYRGRVIPVFGAGASLGSRGPATDTDPQLLDSAAPSLPTAVELAHHLAEMIEFPAEESPDLTKVAQYYSVVGGRQALDSELHDIFAREYAFTPLHTFLARVPTPLLIVTTNYDDLIERALTDKGRAYDVVVHTTGSNWGERVLWWPHGESEPHEAPPNKLDIDLEARTVIYKMHGAVDRRRPSRDQYVITEDDYIEFLARMTRNRAIPAMFAEPFQTRHFLFLGYGLRDWNLRVVLNRIEKDLRRPKGIRSWAIQHQPSPLEQRFWQERGVEVYDMNLEAFVVELAALAES